MSVPTPSTYTLLLKSHRTTVFLSALPSLSLKALKSALYSALQESSPHHITSPLPSSAESIILGLPRDPNDWSKGWYPIGDDATLEIDEFEIIGEGGRGESENDDEDDGDGGDMDENDEDEEEDEDDVRGKEKGKRKAVRKGKKKGSSSRKSGWTVEKAGLKDGAVVAYYVRDNQGSGKGAKTKGFVVERLLDEDEGDEEWDDEEEAKMIE